MQSTTSITTMLGTQEYLGNMAAFVSPWSFILFFFPMLQESHLADFLIIFTFLVMSPTAYFGEKVEFLSSVLWLINKSNSSETPTEGLMD